MLLSAIATVGLVSTIQEDLIIIVNGGTRWSTINSMLTSARSPQKNIPFHSISAAWTRHLQARASGWWLSPHLIFYMMVSEDQSSATPGTCSTSRSTMASRRWHDEQTLEQMLRSCWGIVWQTRWQCGICGQRLLAIRSQVRLWTSYITPLSVGYTDNKKCI